jgi:hypothetical protein
LIRLAQLFASQKLAGGAVYNDQCDQLRQKSGLVNMDMPSSATDPTA